MKFQLKRLLSQISFLIFANLGAFNIKTGLCYPFFYCHACPTASSACPLRAIEKGFYDYGFKWKLIVYPILILGLVGITTGRAVCGWACPIGMLQRGTGRVARFINKKIPIFYEIGQWKYEKYFRYIKYFVLFALVIITPFFFMFMFTDICPVGILTGTIPILLLNPGVFVPSTIGFYVPGTELYLTYFYLSMVFFILFISLIFLIERGWCRYFCPVGAILAPFNKISMLHISVNSKECIHCNICSDVCPMGIDVPNMQRDPECVLCGKCVDVCPNDGLKFERTKL